VTFHEDRLCTWDTFEMAVLEFMDIGLVEMSDAIDRINACDGVSRDAE
jgi:hypothetical protein